MFYLYMPETWRQLAAPYENYKVSSHGRVWSIIRRKILTQTTVRGYRFVTMTDSPFNSSQKQVSWLVYNTFCGTAKRVVHYDYCTTNNHFMNLEDFCAFQKPPAPLPLSVLRDIVNFYDEFADSKEVTRAIRYKYYFTINQPEIHRIVRGRAYRKETGIAPRSLNAAKGITRGQDDFDDVFG